MTLLESLGNIPYLANTSPIRNIAHGRCFDSWAIFRSTKKLSIYHGNISNADQSFIKVVVGRENIGFQQEIKRMLTNKRMNCLVITAHSAFNLGHYVIFPNYMHAIWPQIVDTIMVIKIEQDMAVTGNITINGWIIFIFSFLGKSGRKVTYCCVRSTCATTSGSV